MPRLELNGKVDSCSVGHGTQIATISPSDVLAHFKGFFGGHEAMHLGLVQHSQLDISQDKVKNGGGFLRCE